MTQPREHWDAIYERKRPDEVSWYRPHLDQSLRFIDAARLDLDAAIVDVGGGASTLVDDLIARGHTNLTVLDVSARAIEAAKVRLGALAARVRWIVGDVTRLDLASRAYDLWHDRAVFHFLRDAEDRRRYVAAVRRSVKPGGHVVMATFGPNGPSKCSGLEVVRYDVDGLRAQLGDGFEQVGSATELHTTPSGAPQQFVYCDCRLTPPL